jgi:DnaK suppressor protein
MNEELLIQLKKSLLDQRESLVGQVNDIQNQSSDGDRDVMLDPVDMAARDQTRTILLSTSENDRNLLEQIDGALQRMEIGEYGECQNCGNEIAVKRLEAIPWARYCIRCQELQEKGLLDEEE